MTNLNCFGRHRRRTAPHNAAGSSSELVAPPIHSRINGWSLPLHSFQFIALLIYSFMAIVAFGIYVPLLPAPWSYAAYALIGSAFVLHLFSHVTAVTIDPADVNVRRRKDYSSPMPTFDNTKHPHVIDNLHCTLCEVDVSPKAKHCSTCNKCIANFDHHCKWLNNCVGGRNYWFFFTAVSSAVIGVILLFPLVLFVFIEHYVNPAVLRTAPQFQTVKGNGTWLVFLPVAPVETSSISLLVVSFITALLALASLLLLCHLLCFHIYLLSQGISTYEYIVRKRQSPNPKEKQQVPAALPSNGATAQSLELQEPPVNCDAPLSSRSCTFKLEDRGPMPEPICAEMDESNGGHHLSYSSESATQMIAGESAMSLPVVWSLSGTERPQAVGRVEVKPVEGRPVVQDPLGSSIMDTALVHQQLMTEQPQYLHFKQKMP
ncbi:palmitoyltransferase ZDHHC11 [Danio aesculapii]|uniref:palmitoyltransferase ZDHHC11 n=1 Tax=Danio aesculapii TaxID=1142201 RepID=UPI0024BF19A5|nr:palmitoyltransferase ZDHHC11 [Danio aesculapii]